MADGRWENILNRCEDITLLSETHCTDLHQKSFPLNAEDFSIIWGAPVRKGSRSGVAIIAKKSSVWAIQKVDMSNTVCFSHEKQGRLVVAQIFYGAGERSILIYTIYGHAGARWEQARRREAENMIQDIAQDIAARGSIPAIIAGDFNLQINDSPLMQKLLRSGDYVDAHPWGSNAEQAKNTSHKNSGSRIDLPKDHSEVVVDISMPISSQCRYIPIQPNSHYDAPYDIPDRTYEPPRFPIDPDISRLLQLNDVDQACETWCKIAQNYLRIIPRTKANGQKIYDTGNSRGRVLFQKQCRYPKQVHAHSLNIHSRKIAYALSRVQELQRNVHHGTQSLNTWKNLHKVLPSLNNPDRIILQQILHEHIAPHILIECSALLSKCLKESQAEDKKQRLQAWKQKMSNSEKQAYKWLKKEATKDVGTMKLPGGHFTADVNQQLAAFLHIWKPIFQKFSDQSPDIATFRDHFVPFMKKQSMQVAPMTGDLVLKHLWKLKPSSAGLDSWKPESLIALGRWYPHLFNDLAKIFEWIEVNAKWPCVFYKAYTSLIPKPNMSASPGLEDFRPITVLGSIYRLWAKIRFSDALAWQEHWAPNEMWGCRQFRGAEAMCLNIALQLEQVADTKDAVGGGIAYDFRKCFDLIPIDLLFEAMCARGMSDAIIGPLKALYANLKRVFKLKGTCGDFWKATNGLVQGCPLSMIGLNSLVAVVLEIAQIKCPEVVARAYADDLSAVCVSQSKHCLIQSIHRFHRIVKALEEIKFGEISDKKSHTFGHPCLQKAVEPHYAHYTNFRIVGGSFLAENVTATHAELEAERFQTWSRTIERMRHAPWPWRVKARRLMATQSQATFAQGTHS